MRQKSKSKVGITDQTGANLATRQVAKGIGAALQFMAQDCAGCGFREETGKALEKLVWSNSNST